MEQLINKRKEYLKEIDDLNNEIDKKAQEFFDRKVELLQVETQSYRDEVAKQYCDKFKKIEDKIAVIDDIISEQMPEAKEIQNLMDQETVVQIKQDDIVDIQEVDEVEDGQPYVDCVEIISEEPSVEETESVKETPIDEDPIEEVIDLDAQTPVEEIVIPTSDVIEEQLDSTVETEEIPSEEKVEQKEPIVETISTKEDESRPGMPQILNPR